MNENRNKTVLRFAVIFGLFLVGFGFVIGKIIKTQTTDRDKFLKMAEKVITQRDTIPANRGNIYDCNNQMLATTIRTYVIYMDTRTDALRANNGQLFRNNVDALAGKLADFFRDRTKQEYKNALMHAFNTGQRYFRVYPKAISYEQLQTVKTFPLFCLNPYKGGFLAEERYERVKPYGDLAARTIGDIFKVEKTGSHGLEKYFETTLHGTEGLKIRQVSDNFAIDTENKKSIDGADIITTIDINLQDIVDYNLKETLKATKADWGTCILMDVKTGEIKAISNLTRIDSTQYTEQQNYAVIKFNPGSTFKTFSLMAAIDEGKVTINDPIDVEEGVWRYQKATIRDSHKYGEHYPEPQTIRKAFAVSSNVAMAKMVTSNFTQQEFTDYIANLGITDSIPLEIPGKSAPFIQTPPQLVDLAKMSYGYWVELSPIDVLTFYNAIANNGCMVSPHLVKAIESDGKTIKTFKPTIIKSSICKKSTLRDVQTCLQDVVWDNEAPGTAAKNRWGTKKAQSNIVHIAGKTGTAQIYDDGNYSNAKHRISFCGYFPMENPKYTCICVISHPRTRYYDSGAECGGTVRRIAEKVMAYEGMPIETLYQPKDSIKTTPAKREETTITTGLVPNVIGMGAMDAVYFLEKAGLKVKVQGTGKVTQQSIAPDTQVNKGTTITLALK